MEIATQKKEIIDWILAIEDQAVLNEIEMLKTQSSFNFDEEFKKGLTVEEFRKRTTEFIKSLPSSATIANKRTGYNRNQKSRF